MPRAIVKAKGGVHTQGGVFAPLGAEVEITEWEAEHLPGWYEILPEPKVEAPEPSPPKVEAPEDALTRLRRRPPPPPPPRT